MSSLKYEEIGPIDRSAAITTFEGGDFELIARTLIALGLHDSDWRWVQQQGLRFLSHSSELVVRAAILSIAHSARVNRATDKDVVVRALQFIAVDLRYADRVQDALDDIDHYVKDR